MELKKGKFNTLFWLFIKQLLILSIFILMEIITFVLLFDYGMIHGIILPANYSELYLEQNKDIISNSDPFEEALIPHTCKYGLFDYNGTYLSGNFPSDTVEEAEKFLRNQERTELRFYLIDRKEGYCIINYDLSAHFASPVLHHLVPRLELMLLIVFIILFVVIVIFRALRFGRMLNKEINPLLEEISQIKNRELEITHKNSKIKEFDDILSSLYDMKDALSHSLKKEWETEQKRKDNISALAHDIKTPLTIIKGNSELIKEEYEIDEIYKFADIINDNSDRIEAYIKLLIDETKSNQFAEQEEPVKISTLIDKIILQSTSLCKANNIKLITLIDVEEETLLVNSDLIERAVVNLVKNAVEHSTMDRRVKMKFESQEHCESKKYKLRVIIEDYGTGFTKEALKYAKNQFYTEKAERSGNHYGLGMYFASSVAMKYKGGISYYNKEMKDGAIVHFEICKD